MAYEDEVPQPPMPVPEEGGLEVETEFDFSNLLSPKKKQHKLERYADLDNILEELDAEQRQKILNHCLSGELEDKNSQAKWMQSVDDAQRLALLTKEPKNTPLPESASIKFPLITDACYQYAARTYPEIVQDGKVAKMSITGLDPDPITTMAAELGAIHMNYQLLGPDSAWETGVDKLLVVLPNIGFVLKKTYFDSVKKTNRSILCHYKDIILRNDPDIECLDDLRRITHVLHQHPNDLLTGARKGLYDQDTVDEILNYYNETKLNPKCTLSEMHCFYDLDGDGYEEPYIVTRHQETNKLVRIVARYTSEEIEFDPEDSKIVIQVTPVQYFTDFHFLPSPDGCFMSIGFGILMLHLNETVNTIFNQLIDAGKLANMQTGFIDARLKFPGGQTQVDPGEWTRVKGVIGQSLKDGVFPVNYKEPSSVLFQLLGLLIQTGKELTSSTDLMQGSISAQNVPATSMLAMVEQGMKRFSAIQKRMYRSIKDELQKIYRLNRLYTDPVEFAEIVGNQMITPKDVYESTRLRAFPVADPNLATDAQRLAQAQVVMQMSQAPDSLIDKYEAQKLMLEAAKIRNIPIILPKAKSEAPPPPDPKMMKIEADMKRHDDDHQIKLRKTDLQEKEFVAKLSTMEAEVTQMQANSIKLITDAKNSTDKQKSEQLMGEHKANLDVMKTKVNAMQVAHQQMNQSNMVAAKHQADQEDRKIGHAKDIAKMQQDERLSQREAEQTTVVDAVPPPDDSGSVE